ncbi:NAD(P)H-binding protein [Actinomyces procaprae]|uniref:NAD(P)H-binding protein n=1 Tax=Actinomyces procaprae TaxID=2560010 RepID=UPI003B82E239
MADCSPMRPKPSSRPHTPPESGAWSGCPPSESVTRSAPRRCRNASSTAVLRGIYANKAAAEELLRSSDLDWTLVYPTTLTNGALPV